MSDTFEDWVRLPAGQEELDARAHVVATRREQFDLPRMRSGNLGFRTASIPLSPIQSDLVACLVNQFGELVLRRDLLNRLPEPSGGTQTSRNVLDLHMARLRRKLEPVGLTIRTVWGCGYILELADGDVGRTQEAM